MSQPIEAYGVIGDTQTVALVGRDGSIDWMCAPRFDSGACFAALLGTPEHGRWLIAPTATSRKIRRRYRGDSLVLETTFTTESGSVRIIDCMPIRDRHVNVTRLVEGVSGEVAMRMELVIRFDYGSIVPWMRRVDGALCAIAGPDALSFWSPVEARGVGLTTQSEFTVRAGDRLPFQLTWHASTEAPEKPGDPFAEIAETEAWWQEWASRCTFTGEHREAVVRSLITLKALTFAPTGGIVAAATTSLPECIGGVRNWDYRYCWVRDATLTLYALIASGYVDEAAAWRAWLLRAVAGNPADLQIMYGVAGERRINEIELPWLPGYEGSRPVRVGNAAVKQHQLDVYGELLDALHLARRAGVVSDGATWALELKLLEFVERMWVEPDNGIWEARGPRRHFTFSKVMAWVAFDRAIRGTERFGLEGPADRWREVRSAIHDDVCRNGFDASRGTFTQFYGGHTVDASLLLIPAVGFLPPHDPRVMGTVACIEADLLRDGLVQRYVHDECSAEVDGLPPGEGAFLACTFWLADTYVLLGRHEEATRVFERLLTLRNDLGLLSEEYDPIAGRLVGNMPQAFSHVALINTAFNLTHAGPAEDRARADEPSRIGFGR